MIQYLNPAIMVGVQLAMQGRATKPAVKVTDEAATPKTMGLAGHDGEPPASVLRLALSIPTVPETLDA